MEKFHLLLATVAASIATVVGVVLMHNPAPAPSDPFEGLHMSAPDIDAEDVDESDPLLSPIVSYESETYDYKLKFPATWSLDDTKEEFDGDLLSDPSERVVITISETEDILCVTPYDLERIAYSIRESLRHDSAFELTSFQKLFWKDQPAIFTEGARHIGGKRYHTREYNIVRPGGSGILNMSITTQEDAETLYEQALQDILHSLEVFRKK